MRLAAAVSRLDGRNPTVLGVDGHQSPLQEQVRRPRLAELKSVFPAMTSGEPFEVGMADRYAGSCLQTRKAAFFIINAGCCKSAK